MTGGVRAVANKEIEISKCSHLEFGHTRDTDRGRNFLFHYEIGEFRYAHRTRLVPKPDIGTKRRDVRPLDRQSKPTKLTFSQCQPLSSCFCELPRERVPHFRLSLAQ